ncbi:hypothetical protein GCM10023195_71160 [Actinoallomurus liliacearum]|uniref:Sigma-70 family RNA polymerase sigma factor n=1 Tax=Actinoallomurus liliacearum TaxID=1080073 RepID=A0ABP8TTJ6_9ACTN
MSASNGTICSSTNRPTPLDRAAQAFGQICSRINAPTVDGRRIGHGVPRRRVNVRELVEILPLLEADGRDAVWRELVRLSREHGEPWPTIAIGIALPGLRTAAARLTRGYAGDSGDLDAELVTAFYEALRSADIGRHNVCGGLRAVAYNQVRRMRYGTVSYSARTVDLDALPESIAPVTRCGHPDMVLAKAVRAAVIDRREAELIGATRLEDLPLTTVAKKLGMAVTTAWCRRRSAETRLASWIKENDNES